MITVAILGTVIALVIAAAVSPKEILAWTLVCSAIACGFVLWIYFGTYYEFYEEYLLARSGPFTERIYYDRITEINMCRNFYSSMALAADRVFIRTDKKGLLGMTYVSPEDREGFVAELKSRTRLG